VEDDPKHLARTLIAIHGEHARNVAQRAVDSERQLGRLRAVDEWTRVVAEIKRIQKTA
jgi:hypothetical protein